MITYNRHWMAENPFPILKRMLGAAVRVRSWPLELREMILKCAVYNLPVPSDMPGYCPASWSTEHISGS